MSIGTVLNILKEIQEQIKGGDDIFAFEGFLYRKHQRT